MKILNIPFSAGGLGKSKGCEKAPELIVKNLKELYLNENKQLPVFDFINVPINQSNIEETNNNIQAKVKKNINNKFVIIGGDHSITFSAFKEFAKQSNPGLLIFDAHPDCVNNFSPPTHEDFVNVLISEKIIPAENIILVGLRNWHSTELKFLQDNKIRFFTMKQLHNDMENMIDTIMDNCRKFSNLYVSIDIDVIDPAFAPGTGYIEPAGLTSREFIHILQRIKFLKNIKAFDLVEINPDKDINNLTVKLGAKILSELI
jgi:arginase family enzyme